MNAIIQKQIIKNNNKNKFLYENISKILPLLDDDNIIEIMLNQDEYIYVDSFDGMYRTDIKITPIESQRIIEIIASINNKVIDVKNPYISATLPTGERVEAIIGENSKSKPVFAIRKRAKKVFYLSDYLEQEKITEYQKEYLENAISNRKNILIVGATGSGKTTFANALLDVLKDSNDRIAIIEDIEELQCNSPNKIEFISSKNMETIDILRSCMRLRPDRIIIGELRTGINCLELLKAWNSGHSGGITTIHANDSLSGLYKLEQYIDECTIKTQSKMIANSINICVFMEKKKVKEILEIKGYDTKLEKYIYEEVEAKVL